MLHWLAGQKPPEGSSDPDATALIDAPETPAPLFAVRAFKHAIFGTPQTVQPKPRRHSNTDGARPKHHDGKATRPVMIRPKSANEVQSLGKEQGSATVPEAMASPTKGILMTPGTAAARRKTVTFGAQVVDNEEKKPTKSGLPDDCPGKFPSPWTKTAGAESTDAPPKDSKKGKSKLTEALEQVREDSARKSRVRQHELETSDDDPGDFAEPKSESGRYWKTQYDVYRENTQREVKKLITKQKSAKSFAKEKDTRCTELEAELNEQKGKVERLEKRTLDLEAEIKQLRQKLDANPSTVQQSVPNQQLSKAGSEMSKPVEPRLQTTIAAPSAQRPTRLADAQTQPASTAARLLTVPNESARQAKPDVIFKARSKNENIRTNDIWAQSMSSPTIAPHKTADVLPTSPRGGRMVTSGTDLTPLKALSINTLPTAKLTRRDSAQPSPPNDRTTMQAFIRHDSATADKAVAAQSNTFDQSTTLPVPSSQPTSLTRQTRETATDEPSSPQPVSSPFQPMMTSQPNPSKAQMEKSSRPSNDTISRKENISPGPKSNPAAPELRVKPSAAWNAINAPHASKRIASVTDKSGKVVGVDRLEAARARLAARGRVVS